jgi:integrase
MWAEKHGSGYRIRDRIGGKTVTLDPGPYPTKASARNVIAALRADRLRGDFIDPRGGRVTLDAWLDAWWPGYEASLKPNTQKSAGGLLRRYIRPMLGPLALDDLGDPLVVQRWVGDLGAGRTPVARPRRLAPKTVRNAHGLLHKVCNEAVRARLIRANPCATTSLPPIEHHEMRFLTEPEAERLLAAVDERWRPLVLLLIFTGLRWAEAVGLRAGRLDVLARRLTVVETLQELADTAEIVFGPPKSRTSRRTVTFPVRVAEALIGVGTLDRDELVFNSARGRAGATPQLPGAGLAARGPGGRPRRATAARPSPHPRGVADLGRGAAARDIPPARPRLDQGDRRPVRAPTARGRPGHHDCARPRPRPHRRHPRRGRPRGWHGGSIRAGVSRSKPEHRGRIRRSEAIRP